MTPETVPCPGCAGPMGLDEEVCPHCRRPRDEREIERGKQELIDEERRRQRRPYALAARAAAGLLVLGLFLSRHALFRAASSLGGKASAELADYTDPDFVAGRSKVPAPAAAPDAAAEETTPSPFSAPAASSRSPAPRAPRPASAANVPDAIPLPKIDRSAAEPPSVAEKKARPAEEPDAPDAANWLVYGVVFDFATCRPVRRARIVVRRASERGGVTVFTDAEGHYLAYVPRGIGRSDDLLLEATAPGYRPGQTEDHNPSWLELPEKSRLAALAELTEGDLEPIPLKLLRQDGLMPVDVALAPEPAKGAR